MNEKIEQIKKLLDELDLEAVGKQEQQFTKNYNAFELPGLVSSIIDYLHPILTPYEIAVYWYLFNKSIVKTGDQYARGSIRGMYNIAVSASGKSQYISQNTIINMLRSLEEKNVISKAGDTNREGTLYKIAIPDEIPLCKELIQRKAEEDIVEIDIKKELDYYNVRENRLKIFERDGYKCHYCSKQLTRFSATLDHIQPVSKGGDNSYDNLVTACLHCNSERGNKPVMDYITKP